ncbi:MAG: tRNA (N6-isopentenyl adenosine(37)-C2)-methylthiotransferase MiaB, partial [Candidatus Omnitrophota bacterium]
MKKGSAIKTVFIRTFGCQMNMRDSEMICGLLQKAGYAICDHPDKADVIIVNTCSVRQHAEDRVWSQIGAYKSGKIIGLVGCMAQHHKDSAFNRCPNISFVIGPQDIQRIPETIAKLISEKFFERKIWETDSPARPETVYHTGFYDDKKHASVVISEGCSNFCTYCIVPYVRGPLRHRRLKDIITEIKEALDKGLDSITLLGQNVNAYNDGSDDFLKLLKKVDNLPSLREFDFLTSHPKDTKKGLFSLINDLGKLKRRLHLPVQSGSDRILKLMKRGYNRKFYSDLVSEYRKVVKGGILTTDIIVGFPSENAEDFQETYSLVKDTGFNSAFIFKYSPRSATEAFRMADSVSKKEKEERHRMVLELQQDISG